MFKNNQELYDFVDVLILKLKEIDEQQWAVAFQDAKTISAMPGEILGELRAAFIKFRKTRIPKEIGVQNEVKDAIKYLNHSLSIFRIFDS